VTKTFAKIAARHDVKSGEPGMMPLTQWQTGLLFGFLKLDHWDLFEIWYLVLGIFMIFIQRVIFAKLGAYLLK
jgi:hypothetical protein